MASPTNKDQLEDSSASDVLDNVNSSEDTSTSNPSEKEPSTFDVIMDAIKKPEGETDEDVESDKDKSDKTEDDASKDGKSKDEEDESDEPSADELKAWKPKTRERFAKLQVKYRDANERAEKAEAEAGHYRQFVDFLDTNGINQNEANELFNIGALMKTNPFEALKLITPHYNSLLEITGNVLPADLVQQVKAGYMTQAAAFEVSRARAQGRVIPAVQQQTQQRQEVRQQGQNVASMQSAIGSWEQKWSKSDPDYNVKKDRVLDRLELTLARAVRTNTLPKTAEQAVALAEKVRKEVETELRQTRVRKPVSTVDGGNANSSQQPEPKDSRELARRMFNV